MTMDFPSGEIAGLETLTIFRKSPSSILRACAFALRGIARAKKSATRIPRNVHRADRAEPFVFESVSTDHLLKATSNIGQAIRARQGMCRTGAPDRRVRVRLWEWR